MPPSQKFDVPRVQEWVEYVDIHCNMIELHRPDGTLLLINVAHIVTLETTPDTVLTLYGGDKLRIKEDGMIVRAAMDAWFRRFVGPAVLPLPPPPGGHGPNDDKED